MKFVAFGDSVMWGQGLLDEDKFVVKAAKAMAARAGAVFNRSTDLQLLAHSGAPISMSDLSPDHPPHLPLPANHDSAARADFLREWRFFFAPGVEETSFLAKGNLPNEKLSGEVARDFPTVLDQIDLFPATNVGQVDVVFVSGGANDLDFVKYIADNQASLEADQAEIKRILTLRYTHLLRRAAAKFPKALIIAIGYFPILSNASDINRLKTMAYDVQNISQGNRNFNEWLQEGHREDYHPWYFLGLVESKDVTGYARKAIQYTQNAYYASSTVMHKVVRELSLPNVIFVEPGIDVSEALFSNNSHIFEGYLDRLAIDKAKPVRVAAGMPWLDNYDAHHQVSKRWQDNLSRERSIDKLEDELRNGPSFERKRQIELEIRTLQTQCNAYLISEDYKRLNFLFGRRARMPIFSFLHPNEKGADNYYQNIMKRYDTWRSPSLRDTVLRTGGSLKNYMDRFEVRQRNLRAIVIDGKADTVVVKIKAKQGFFWGFDGGFVNSVVLHLKSPIGARSSILVPSLKVSSFASFLDANTGLPRALDADNNLLWGCFPIVLDQLEAMGGDKVYLNDIAAVELKGVQMPHVVDVPTLQSGAAIPTNELVLTDSAMTCAEVMIEADCVPVVGRPTSFLWKKKNGANPALRLDFPV